MPPKPELPDDPEDLVPQDDRAITNGLKWSLRIVVFLVVFGAVLYIVFAGRPESGPVQVTKLAAPQALTNAASVSIPHGTFSNITSEAGITFRHFTGAEGEKLLPETMGAGVAFLDMDGDGDQDLLFINGTSWPWSKKPDPTAHAALYRNETVPGGPVKFQDISAGSGLDVPLYGMGAAVGDYDNDGRVDVLITGVGGAHLFHNEGNGRFQDVTAAAGVGGLPGEWSSAAVWFDLENDGDLDLYVASYVKWSREIDAEVGYKIDGTTRAYGPPMNFEGAFPHLYRNAGGNRFTDVSATAGVQVKNPATGVPAAKSLGVAPVDFNGDGYMDLVVANDTVQNFVFENRKDGTFVDVGALTGIAFDSYGNTRGAMGIDTARFTGDGRLGVAIGNFANEMTALYVAGKDPALFTDEAISWGVGPASRLPLKFGVFFFDWDLDGRLDLLNANGHLEEEITKVQASQKYRQSAQLFWNAGDAGFLPVDATHAGAALFTPIVGRGSARADIDGDGDEDVVLTQVGGAPMLLRNDQALHASWIRLQLVGTRSNRDGAGARITVRVGDQIRVREVTASRSYLSASELPVTIGLGSAARPDSVEITWPGGTVQSVPQVEPGRLTVVKQTPP
jgi:hypothetical protein